jgi:23S rRNA G2445 N2-methylase RlmL
MHYYLHTLPGLGPLAWQEATGRPMRLDSGQKNRRDSQSPLKLVPGRNDIVLLRSSKSVRHLLKLRLSEDVFAVAARGFRIAPDERGLRQVYAAVKSSDMVGDALHAWGQALRTRRVPLTFRVVTREVGKHQYRRRDIGQAVADAVRAGWPGRWKQVDEEADIELWVNLLEQELVCGIRLSQADMRQRRGAAGSQEWHHLPAALRPALAAAMVMLTRPAAEDVFLDPMAGTGTLLVERAAVGPFKQLYAGDNDPEALAALHANTQRIKGTLHCEQWDARSLPLPDQSIDKIAVNLPFGKRVQASTDLPKLYRPVLAELQRVLRPDGRLVALAGDAAVLEAARAAAAPRLRSEARHRVTLLGQPAAICVFECS